MKKILFPTLLVLVALFNSACNNDGNAAANNIAGNWNLTNLYYTGTTSTTIPGLPPITASFVGEGQNYNATLTFTESPNEFTSTGDYDVQLTTTVTGNPVPQVTTVQNQNFLSQGTWTISGNQITLTADTGEVSTANLTFSNNNNTVTIATTLTITTNQAGATVVQTINYEATCNRQ